MRRRWGLPMWMVTASTLAVSQSMFGILPPPTREPQPERALGRARAHMAEGHVAAAMHELRRVADAVGNTSLVLIEMARCYLEIDRLDDAHATLVDSVDARMRELGATKEQIAAAKHLADASRSPAPTATPRAAPPPSPRPSARGSNAASEMPRMAEWGGNFTANDSRHAVANADVGGEAWGTNAKLLPWVRDPVMSVAFTELARVELRRIDNLEIYGAPETGSMMHLAVRSGRVDATAEIEFRRRRARLWLTQALMACEQNPVAAALIPRTLRESPGKAD